MVKDLNNIRKRNEDIFDTINPILQEYMKENSIDLIFDKRAFLLEIKIDLTQSLIDEINSKIRDGNFKLTKQQIRELLPHREPMLLIDELYDIQKLHSATAVVYVNKDSFFVQGHSPINL